jgi:hypothetical protein
MTIDLDHVVGGMPAVSSERDLMDAWDRVAGSLRLPRQAGAETVLTVSRDVTLLATGDLEPAWGGGWRWNLADGAVRAVATSVLLAATLAAVGIPGLPAIVIPTVLPLLFDIERVRLDREDERVLRVFGARADAAARTGDPAALYASLPDHVRLALSLDEFQAFLESATRAGRATESGGRYEVLPDGETTLRITLA